MYGDLTEYKTEQILKDDCDDYMPKDVVPKSEVERLEAEKDALIKNYAECMKDYAREIFEEIDSRKIYLRDITGTIGIVVRIKDIAELKKKYTESEE
jgi:hypothetical protein